VDYEGNRGELRKLEEALAAEHGPFTLFALFLREGAPDVWDVVVAAAWIDRDEPAALWEIAVVFVRP
jgi:hypothetical protein